MWSLTVILACVWIATLLMGETVLFRVPRWRCSWPEPQQKQMNSSEEDSSKTMIKVALIADAQLTDRTSHGMAPGSMALKLTEFYSDIYMRRAFRSSVLGLKPDEIIFLGDQFDGGPYLTNSEWEESLRRFRHVFDQSERGIKSRTKRTIPVHYLAGNDDLGYHQTFAQYPTVIKRYQEAFGSIDYNSKIGGINFVFVNAQALDGLRSDPTSNTSWNFVEQLSSDPEPRILLTHIPLYRPDDTPCGRERASRVINQRLRRTNLPPGRIIYQDYLSEETSSRLLNLTNPILVFSGHDHDQCKFLHSTDKARHLEFTVGTFSWQQGNIYPSFMLLSIFPSVSKAADASVSTNLCFLPAQDFVYIWYGILFLISVTALFFWPVQGLDLWPAIGRAYASFRALGASKEKDEDTEWEMVWDAEGGMHLVSKDRVQNGASQQEQSGRRGNAVLRAAAKSRAAEATSSSLLESSEASINKCKTVSLRFRVKRMVGPLIVLLAVNLSLYMILVVTDWE